MATVNLPTTLLETAFLVVDDEPEHIQWLIDYIEAKDMRVHLASSVQAAIALADVNQYRGYIVDLNIPMGEWTPPFPVPSDVYEKYKGFYVIKYVRTQGNGHRNVTAYSAHHNDQILAETKTLYCEYTSKEKAKNFKTEIDRLIATPLLPREILRSTRPT